ncbi:MAG: hypothetical protein HGA45_08715, partial [Chloroflexales bacterium]|nr:hypothetical protein [Chloroflexales bacterium]
PTTLTELHSGGVLSEHVYSELVGEVDAALAEGPRASVDDAGSATAPADERGGPRVAPAEHERAP